MKKAIIVLFAVVALVAAPAAFGQAAAAPAATTAPAASTSNSGTATPTPAPAAEVGAPDATRIGVDTAQQKLKQVSVDKFEAAGFWNVYMSADDGFIQGRLFEGAPAGKEPNADERYVGIDPKVADKYVLGLRADFFRRGFNEIYVMAKRPIPIEGITKTISVWVVGRNYNHTLKIILQDFFGNRFELPLGKLNFQGWKQLSVAIPPQNPDGSIFFSHQAALELIIIFCGLSRFFIGATARFFIAAALCLALWAGVSASRSAFLKRMINS